MKIKKNVSELLGLTGNGLLTEFQSTKPAKVIKNGQQILDNLNVLVRVEASDLRVYADDTYVGALGFVSIEETASGYIVKNLTSTESIRVSNITLQIDRI